MAARWHKKFATRLESPKANSAEERKESFECFDTSGFKEGYQDFQTRDGWITVGAANQAG